MSLLITGGTGFVGRTLVQRALEEGRSVRLALRDAKSQSDAAGVVVGEIHAGTQWTAALAGVHTVIHLAARVHVMAEGAADPLAAFRAINTEGTLALARQAANAGVRRFVLVSSIKVNGERTQAGQPFTEHQDTQPEDPYGRSKWEAELRIRDLARETGLEVVIVRPPLVYGPGVKANFAAMMRAIQRGLPLPLASVTHNRRSLVSLDNLVDLLITCIDHPAAANQTFLVSDGEDLSTADLLRRLGDAMGKPARLFPVPVALLRAGTTLIGKQSVAQRLLDNLQVDTSHTRETLGWMPPVTVDEGLRRAVAGLRTP